MLRRKPLILLLIVLFTVWQSTTLNYIQIFGNKPDILLILVIFFSLNFGKIYGLATGALCGLLTELTCGLPAGAAIFVYSLGGVILGHLGRIIYPAFSPREEIFREAQTSRRKIFAQMGISFLFSLAIYLGVFTYLRIVNVNLPLFNTLTLIILPASCYTALVSPVLFHFLRLLKV